MFDEIQCFDIVGLVRGRASDLYKSAPIFSQSFCLGGPSPACSNCGDEQCE